MAIPPCNILRVHSNPGLFYLQRKEKTEYPIISYYCMNCIAVSTGSIDLTFRIPDVSGSYTIDLLYTDRT